MLIHRFPGLEMSAYPTPLNSRHHFSTDNAIRRTPPVSILSTLIKVLTDTAFSLYAYLDFLFHLYLRSYYVLRDPMSRKLSVVNHIFVNRTRGYMGGIFGDSSK